jgi:hypothetical protein
MAKHIKIPVTFYGDERVEAIAHELQTDAIHIEAWYARLVVQFARYGEKGGMLPVKSYERLARVIGAPVTFIGALQAHNLVVPESGGLRLNDGMEPKRSAPKADPTIIPITLDTAEFREAWAAWMLHRKQKGNPVTASTAAAQFRQLQAWGVHRAVKSIEQSILMGWMGLFEPPGTNKTDPSPHSEALEIVRLMKGGK